MTMSLVRCLVGSRVHCNPLILVRGKKKVVKNAKSIRKSQERYNVVYDSTCATLSLLQTGNEEPLEASRARETTGGGSASSGSTR